MTQSDAASVLGSSAQETPRLQLQVQTLAPLATRALREAGIGAGASVRDLGTSVGDVARIAAAETPMWAAQPPSRQPICSG